MLAFELRFPAGRYHATPWGRHVNEADIAWPPDPWRLTRALIATWHRKADHEQFPRERLDTLLRQLNAAPPHYALPQGVHAHTRHYMPARGGKTNLVFDAFARVDPDTALTIVWLDLDLTPDTQALLDTLLDRIGYLGRAESWVEARRLPAWNGDTNCVPGHPSTDPDTGEINGEAIRLQMPITPDDYQALRDRTLQLTNGKKPPKKLQLSLPTDWLSAIETDNSVLQSARWSTPPAAKEVPFVRPIEALRTNSPLPLPTRRARDTGLTTARFAIYGKPLSRVDRTLPTGEHLRRALIGCAKDKLGADHIPALLSGHDLPAGNRHQHAFYLPEDSDGDGEIDHLLVHIPGGIDAPITQVLTHFSRVGRRSGQPWRLVLEGIGPVAAFEHSSTLCGHSDTWVSATPYLHPWHRKSGFGYAEQVQREFDARGLPGPTNIEPVEEISVAGRSRTATQFHRFRRGKNLTQPDQRGTFLRLHFDQSIHGPLALGYACHFGLGLFRPE